MKTMAHLMLSPASALPFELRCDGKTGSSTNSTSKINTHGSAHCYARTLASCGRRSHHSMRTREKGFALVLVLILVGFGAMLLTPTLNFAFTSLRSKQVVTTTLNDQYARDGCTEVVIWQLMYGGADALLTAEGDETTYSCELNDIPAEVTLTLQAKVGNASVNGAEDNKIRPTNTVECDEDGSGDYGDDCLSLPALAGMLARTTVFLDQISPDVSDSLEAIYLELPKAFTYVTGSATSLDGSFPEIVSTTPTVETSGGDQYVKWNFSPPISFTQGQVRQFTYEANINNNADRYCNDVWLKRQNSPPFEKMGKETDFLVGASPPDGCDKAGLTVRKFVNQLVAPPNVTTIFTYIVNVENRAGNTENILNVKDVLPQGGFNYCSPTNPPPVGSCDPPKMKEVDTPFDPATDDFNDLTGFTDWFEPNNSFNNGRNELIWNPSPAISLSQAGDPTDTFILRFQAEVTPTDSGTYFNEIFVDVNCPIPSPLKDEGITKDDYCADYSWPTAGTVVPTYDVWAETDRTSAQGNFSVDWALLDGQLESWHVN